MKLLKVILVLLSVITGNSSKSIFVHPTFRPTCPQGFVMDNFGACVELFEINSEGHEFFLIAKISSFDYDDTDESESEPMLSDEPDDNGNSSEDSEFPLAPPSTHLNFQDYSGPDVLEQAGNFSDSSTTILKDKRSTAPFVELQNETYNLSQDGSNISHLINTNTNQQLKKIVIENINPFNHIQNGISLKIQAQINSPLVQPLPGNSIESVNVATEATTKTKLQPENSSKNSNSKTFMISLLKSGKHMTNKKNINLLPHSSSAAKNIGKFTKVPHNRKWRHLNIFELAIKGLAGKHKNKS